MIKDLHEINQKKRWACLQYGHTANCDLLNNESEVWGCTLEKMQSQTKKWILWKILNRVFLPIC